MVAYALAREIKMEYGDLLFMRGLNACPVSIYYDPIGVIVRKSEFTESNRFNLYEFRVSVLHVDISLLRCHEIRPYIF